MSPTASSSFSLSCRYVCFIGVTIVNDCAFADYMGRAIARVFTVVSVIELFSSSLHERASTRLAVAHDLVSPGEHSSCRDWFECLLQTKAALSQQECPSEGELNYFNGMSVTSALEFCDINVIVQAGGVKVWYIVFLCRALSTGHPQ